MSFKSYAQGGQYGTYHIDIPIKSEINEDLRAAGNFAKQMERSQKYREKWASSYLSALNEKSSIERQNRDDNFEFAQNNYKRIYEGEQREFEGRMAELKRNQAKAANAEPGILEKLAPLLLEGAKLAAGMLAETAAAEHAAKVENIQNVGDAFDLAGIGNIATVQQDFLSLESHAQVARAQEYGDRTGIAPELIKQALLSDGKYQNSLYSIAAQQAITKSVVTLDGMTSSGGELDAAGIPRKDWLQKYRPKQMELIWAEMGGGDIETGKKYWNELPSNVRSNGLKELGKIQNKHYALADKFYRAQDETIETNYDIKLGHEAINHQQGAGYGLYLHLQQKRAQFEHLNDGGLVAMQKFLKTIERTPTAKASHLRELQIKIREETGNVNGGGLQDNMLTEYINKMEGEEQDHMHKQTLRARRGGERLLETIKKQTIAAESNEVARNLLQQVTADPDFTNTPSFVQTEVTALLTDNKALNQLRNPSVEKKMGLSLVSQNNGVKEALARILSHESSAYKDLKNEEVSISQIRLGAQVKFMDDAWRKNQSSAALANPEMLWRAAVNETIKEQRTDGSLSFRNMKADGTPENPAKPMTTHLVAGTDFTSSAPHGTLQFNRVEAAVDQQGIGVLEDILFEIDPGSLTKSLTTYGTLIKKMQANGEEIERKHVQGLLGSRAIREGARAANVDAAVYLDMQGKAHEKKTGIKWPGLGSKVRFEKEDELRNQKLVDRMFQGYNVPTDASNYITSTQTWQPASYIAHSYAHGQLPQHELATVTGQVNSTQMYKEVAPHLQRLVDDAAAAGHTLKFNSGYRTTAEQQHLYNTKPPGIAARPGTSEHELGYSVDLHYSDAGYKWLQQNAHKYGFQPFAPGLGPDDPEAWHWTFRGNN